MLYKQQKNIIKLLKFDNQIILNLFTINRAWIGKNVHKNISKSEIKNEYISGRVQFSIHDYCQHYD